MLLPTDQEVPGSIPDSAMGSFSSRKLFHGMCRLGVSVFHCPSSMFSPMLSLEEAPALCWLQVLGDPPIVSLILCVGQRNFLHYRALACKFLAKVELKLEKKERIGKQLVSCRVISKYLVVMVKCVLGNSNYKS